MSKEVSHTLAGDCTTRISLLLRLRLALLRLFPGDVRRKASRLVALGDAQHETGHAEAARYIYEETLDILEVSGIHHLTKKVRARLDDMEDEATTQRGVTAMR